MDVVLVALVVLLLAKALPVEGIGARLALGGVLLGSVLWHELGHATMARRRGVPVSGIYLHLVPFAWVGRGTAADEWRVALAGPLASLLAAGALGAVLSLVDGWPPAPADPLSWFGTPLAFAVGINGLMATVNLVPALPLDGGRVLEGLVRATRGAAAARVAVAVAGLLVGGTVAAVGLLALAMPTSTLAGVLGAWLALVGVRRLSG